VAYADTTLAAGLGVGGLEVINTFDDAPSNIPATALRTRSNDPLYTRANSVLLTRG